MKDTRLDTTSHRRATLTTHTLTNPYGDTWLFATARGQMICAVNAADIDAAAALVGKPGDTDSHYRWLRRGPGRYSRAPIFYGACGVESCVDCLPIYDTDNVAISATN